MLKVRNSSRRALLGSAVMLAIAAPVPAIAQAQTFQLNIPAQALDGSLRAFARATRQQILFDRTLVRSRMAPALVGNFTVEDGLERLLMDSGLTAVRGRRGAFVVTPGSGEALAAGAAAENEGANQGGVAEILVVGQRSLNVDVRRTENDTQPYVVIGAQEIQRSGATNVEQFLRNRLPMNTQQATAAQSTTILDSGLGGQINLRGLGPGQTLILVDGRRTPNLSTFTSLTQSSINGIPLAAIDRIEILPATASGIYGGSATGGVINIILKREYSGFDASSTYGNTFRGDMALWQISISGGVTFNEGKTRFNFGASRTEQGNLLATDRNTMGRRSRELLQRNDPSGFTSPPAGYTPNICATSTGTSTTCIATILTLDPQFGGASLGSNLTSVPLSYGGPSGDNGTGLVSNAGRYNFDFPPNALSLIQGEVAESVYGTLRQDVTSDIDLFIDLHADRVRSRLVNGTMASITLPAASPNNPFQQNIRVSIPVPDLALESTRNLTTYWTRGGLIARLGGGWSGSAEFGWSQSRASFTNEQATTPTAAGLTYLQSIALQDQIANPPVDPRSRFNIFREEFGPRIVTQFDQSLRVGGPLFRLPGGPLSLTGLLEHRRQKIGQVFDVATTVSWGPSASQEVTSGYVEARVPIFGDENATTLLHSLELMGAVRRDAYRTRAVGTIFTIPSVTGPFPNVNYGVSELSSTDYTLGVSYSPVAGLVFRASFGTGFLPPNLNQIAVTSSPLSPVVLGILRDPLRGNSPLGGIVTNLAGGNPDIRPEESESLSIGMIFEPRFFSGLRLSVDYVQIEKRDEIATLGTQFFIDSENLFPGRIVRGPKLPGDPAEWSGPITQIDQSAVNLSSTRVRAYDFQLDYRFNTRNLGSWHFYAVATYQPTRENRVQLGSAPVDTVGFTNGVLEWRGNFGFDWTSGPWSFGWNAQYYDGYRACTAIQTALSCATTSLRQGSPRISTQIYNDLYLNYRFGQTSALGGGLRDLELALGIQNVFDHSPPAVAGSSFAYSTYGDPRLRRLTFSVRKHF